MPLLIGNLGNLGNLLADLARPQGIFRGGEIHSDAAQAGQIVSDFSEVSDNRRAGARRQTAGTGRITGFALPITRALEH